MRAVVIGLLGAFVASASIAASSTPVTKPITGEAKAYAFAFRIIREHRLLPKNYMQCFMLLLESEDARKIAKFEARESHKRKPPQCDGEPDTALRLFGLEIDMRTGKAWWDRITDDNSGMVMRPVPPRYY